MKKPAVQQPKAAAPRPAAPTPQQQPEPKTLDFNEQTGE